MSLLLESKRKHGATKNKKVVGRGNGSGHGTYSTRGVNGQNARTGGGTRPGFQGGQTPIYRKMPKLGGFKNVNRVEFQAVNLRDLELFNENDEVTPVTLKAKNLIRTTTKPVKILASGKLTKKLKISVHKLSEKAKTELEKSGSTITELMKSSKCLNQ